MERDWNVRGVEKLTSSFEPRKKDAFLVMERMRCRTLYRDRAASAPYDLACVHRRGVDSVAVMLYDPSGGRLRVGLRKALRPILYFRTDQDLPLPDARPYPWVWEAVAGSLELEDRGEEGLRRRVVEEVWEEAGFRIPEDRIEELGAGFFPSHGQSSEKIHLRAVRVREEDQDRRKGRGTGPSEEGLTCFFDADEVLRMCWEGGVEDPKVEIGVRRLRQKLSCE